MSGIHLEARCSLQRPNFQSEIKQLYTGSLLTVLEILSFPSFLLTGRKSMRRRTTILQPVLIMTTVTHGVLWWIFTAPSLYEESLDPQDQNKALCESRGSSKSRSNSSRHCAAKNRIVCSSQQAWVFLEQRVICAEKCLCCSIRIGRINSKATLDHQQTSRRPLHISIRNLAPEDYTVLDADAQRLGDQLGSEQMYTWEW